MSIPKNAIKVFSGELYDIYQWNLQTIEGPSKILERLKGKDSAQLLMVFDDGDVGIGIEEQVGFPPFFGLIGGAIRSYEELSDTIERELLESTGFKCADIIHYKSISVSDVIIKNSHYFIGRGIDYVRSPKQVLGLKTEIIKISIEELMRIMGGEYFRDKEFAFDLFKEFYIGGISRVRAVLGLWEGIQSEDIIEPKKELAIKKKKTAKKVIKKKIIKAKPVTKVKKIVIKKPLITKKKIITKQKTIVKKAIIKKKPVPKLTTKSKAPKKIDNFKSFLDKMEKKIKKREAEFDEPLL